ncbi:MAG: YceI family protein [Bacteroidia bacterium]
MKNVFLLAIIASVIVACSSPSASTEASEAQEEVAEAVATSVAYTVDVVNSQVAWRGTKPTGDFHGGLVSLTSGELSVENGAVSAGNFVVDMGSMVLTDEGLDEETTGKLLGHLKSPDFFDVEGHSTASFSITGSTADSLTGNLTIKGVSKSISIPYTLTEEEGAVSANAEFSIDRTIWGVTYNSGNFFKDLGDYLIDDAIQFRVKLVATK